MLFAAPAIAQDDEDADDPQVETIAEDDEEAEESSERVVVTGSRIQRDEFTSPSPVQVITAGASRDIGLVSPDLILQDSTVTQGQQIDGSFAGFVLDNGPASSTVNLRGLGSDRSLVLINGRRLAPAGVEGVPTQPSVNLLPGTVIERFDILLDGASSVYGSDAVAGVVNVILEKDFDGLELFGNYSQPFDGGGEETTVSAKWGVNSDRGFSGFALEYQLTEALNRRDRDWSNECTKDLEIVDATGELRTEFIADNLANPLQRPNPCQRPRLVGRVSVPVLGSVYANEFANFLAPNADGLYPGFSESNFLSTGGTSIGVDSNGDGINDVEFFNYTPNGSEEWLDSDIFSEVERLNAFAYGEYQTDVLGGATFFYEALYSNLQSTSDAVGSGGGVQLFPIVPASNPYNICNPDGFGVDCGVAFDNFFLSDAYSNVFEGLVGAPSTSPGFAGFLAGPLGPQDVQPIVRVQGDRNITAVELTQSRLVGGFRGDVPFLNFGPVRDWTYEASMVYSRSNGDSSRVGVRDDRLNFSLRTSAIDPSTGEVVCGVDDNGDGIPDGFDDSGNVCVPINMFAPSLYNGGEAGDFATQEERDYVFGDRSFNTVYEQTILSGFLTGNVFELPAGDVPVVLGFEYREDVIESNASDIAADGLLFGFFQDSGGAGSKDLYEAFGEIEIPIAANLPGIYDANLNLSTRWTEEEFYGTDWTYSVKGDYRPVNWLLFRGTAGTSYRAPNVREQFLLNQSGFNNALGDPCLVPEAAFERDPLNPDDPGFYNPALDTRDQQTLDNCVAAGVDPTTLGAEDGVPSGTGTVSAEVITGGTTDIDPETSTAYSAGLVIDQPFFEQFNLTAGATWWSIEVEDALAEPSSQFIVNDCFVLQPDFSSSFCSRIQRGNDGLINTVFATPININTDKASGIDINILFEDDFAVLGRALDLSVDVRATHLLENENEIIGDNGVADVDDLRGSFGFPEWNGQATFRADYDDFRVTWNTRYISQVGQFVEGIDSRFGASQTCLPEELCRDYASAEAYFRHDASIGYNADTWDFVIGVRNLFNEEPPFVNSSEVTTNVNAPVGVGYDLLGRRVFMSVRKNF